MRPILRPSRLATTLAALALGATAITVILTDRAQSLAPQPAARQTALNDPARDDLRPYGALLRGADAPEVPNLGNLSLMHQVTAWGADQPVDEPYCDQRPALIAKLASEYDESRVGLPQWVEGIAVELWASARIGSWTVIASRADGIACVLDTGRGWQGETAIAALSGDLAGKSQAFD